MKDKLKELDNMLQKELEFGITSIKIASIMKWISEAKKLLRAKRKPYNSAKVKFGNYKYEVDLNKISDIQFREDTPLMQEKLVMSNGTKDIVVFLGEDFTKKQAVEIVEIWRRL